MLFRSPGSRRGRRLVRAGCAAIAVGIPVGAVAACGSEAPDTPGPQVPSIVASAGQNSGTTTQIGSFVDVITARIPVPPAGAGQAQLEMTLAVTTPGGTSVALTAVSSPAARRAVLLTRGHTTARINVPIQAGENVQIGPPAPYEVLLTGLRERLRLGQSVSVTMTFGRSGRATLAVPVTAAP